MKLSRTSIISSIPWSNRQCSASLKLRPILCFRAMYFTIAVDWVKWTLPSFIQGKFGKLWQGFQILGFSTNKKSKFKPYCSFVGSMQNSCHCTTGYDPKRSNHFDRRSLAKWCRKGFLSSFHLCTQESVVYYSGVPQMFPSQMFPKRKHLGTFCLNVSTFSEVYRD